MDKRDERVLRKYLKTLPKEQIIELHLQCLFDKDADRMVICNLFRTYILDKIKNGKYIVNDSKGYSVTENFLKQSYSKVNSIEKGKL